MNIKHLPCVRDVIHGSPVADLVMFLLFTNETVTLDS